MLDITRRERAGVGSTDLSRQTKAQSGDCSARVKVSCAVAGPTWLRAVYCIVCACCQ